MGKLFFRGDKGKKKISDSTQKKLDKISEKIEQLRLKEHFEHITKRIYKAKHRVGTVYVSNDIFRILCFSPFRLLEDGDGFFDKIIKLSEKILEKNCINDFVKDYMKKYFKSLNLFKNPEGIVKPLKDKEILKWIAYLLLYSIGFSETEYLEGCYTVEGYDTECKSTKKKKHIVWKFRLFQDKSKLEHRFQEMSWK